MFSRSLIAFLLLTALLSFSRAQTADALIYGLTLAPSGIDPHRHQSSELGIPLRQVYDTLVYRHPETLAFVPGLAASWTLSDDGLRYVFRLRDDVTFHDGTPFNAQAVAANLDRITAPETASQRAIFMLGPYEGYEIIGAHTIALRLSQPYAPLLDSLAQVYLGMASPQAIEQYPAGDYQFHQVGTGPYRFVSYQPGDSIILERNPAYAWGPDFYQIDNPPERLEFRFFTDAPTRALALTSGDAHIMGEIPPRDAQRLASDPAISLHPVNVPGQPLQFLFNTAQAPTDERAIRQALLYATDRPTLVNALFPADTNIAWGPLSSTMLGYDPSVAGRYAYEPEAARERLAEAGYADGLRLRMLVPPWSSLPDVALILQDQWRALGIETELVPVANFPALLAEIEAGAYHLVPFNAFGLDPALLNSFYHSAGANNYGKLNDPELDALLDAATREIDPQGRLNLIADIQAHILDEAYVLPLRERRNLNASRGLRGLRFDAYGWFPLLPNILSPN